LWDHFPPTGPRSGHLRAHDGPFGFRLGRFGPTSRPLWVQVGSLGTRLRSFGSRSGRFVFTSRPLWVQVVSPGATFVYLGPGWGTLGPLRAHFGPSLGHLEPTLANLDPCWVALGPLRAHCKPAVNRQPGFRRRTRRAERLKKYLLLNLRFIKVQQPARVSIETSISMKLILEARWHIIIILTILNNT